MPYAPFTMVLNESHFPGIASRIREDEFTRAQ